MQSQLGRPDVDGTYSIRLHLLGHLDHDGVRRQRKCWWSTGRYFDDHRRELKRVHDYATLLQRRDQVTSYLVVEGQDHAEELHLCR